MESEWIEYRGVRARVEITDHEDDENYVVVALTVEGDRVANTDTQGRAYGPLYLTHIKATKKP